MQQVKTILEIHYKELPEIFAYKKRILGKLVGDNVDDQVDDHTFTEDIRLEIENQKAIVLVQSHRTMIAVENNDAETAHALVQELYKKIWDILKISDVNRISYRSLFIKPSTLKFDDLVLLHKNAFFKETSLLQESQDVGLPLTFNADGYRIDFMTGPMTKNELRHTRLDYDNDALPDTFSFAQLNVTKVNHDGAPDAVAGHCVDVRKKNQKYLALWEEIINE